MAFYVKGEAENSGYIGVVAASGSRQDAERLRNSIRSTIFQAKHGQSSSANSAISRKSLTRRATIGSVLRKTGWEKGGSSTISDR